MSHSSRGTITKDKILKVAAKLFAEKGYTETTIRELTEAVDLKNPASLYHYFPSKNDILEEMLEDYSSGNLNLYDEQTIKNTLKNSPNLEGILACMQTTFPDDKVEYFLSVLNVILQEQLRNPTARDYMSNKIIKRAEEKVTTIFAVLKELDVIRQDADPDYWMKVTSSLSQSFATRMMLGIGDSSPDFTGMGMASMLKETFILMLDNCGTQSPGSNESEL